MHQPAVSNLRFGALAKDALQIGNWIARMRERIGPLLLEIRLNHLPHNCDAQIFFALEVMKQCAFGRTRFIYDAIEAAALESVFVKFVESGIEDSLSRVFGRSVGGYSHCAYHTDQSVCRQVQFFLFSIFALFAQIVTRACRNVTLPKPDRVLDLVPGA